MSDRTGTEVVFGPEAASLADSPGFQAQWKELWDNCPWATAFQGPGFVLPWQRIYGVRYEPGFVLSRGHDGKLTGLLPLAAGHGDLVAAGDHQAEYQGWICLPDHAQAFPGDAIAALRKNGINSNLTFGYLPPGTPMGSIADGAATFSCLCTPFRRPLLRFGDGTDVEASLRKSGNKSRLRQLKKLGPVNFRHITDPAEADALLARAIPFYDRRHAEVHRMSPFRDDPQKEPFHRALAREQGLLHISALMIGDRLASLHLNTIQRRTVTLWLISYDPELEHFSPGKLHILFLARMLHEQGYEQLDLTPGGEGYKERFANAWDEVHRLTAYPSAMRRWAGFVRHGLEVAAKRVLAAAREGPAKSRE